MIGILKFLKGYVRIKVWGFSPERFMNLCCNRNILLWNISKKNNEYYMNISLSGFRKLRDIARKTRTRVVIQKRYGLPFFVPKLFVRKFFVLGLCTAVFTIYYSSLFVWKITIDGNLSITDNVMMQFLQKGNIYIGCRRGAIDIEQLEKDIRKKFPEITWTSARFEGTELKVYVKENDTKIIPNEEDTISDLYAEKDGTIVSMIVRKGIAQVKIGDTVTMGSLLVSGSVPVMNEDGTVRKYQYTNADADIEVERIREYRDSISLYYTKKVYTGRVMLQRRLHFGSHYMKLGKDSRFTYCDEIVTEHKISPLNNLILPFYISIHTFREYQNIEYIYTLKEAEVLLTEAYKKQLLLWEAEGICIQEESHQIIEENTTITLAGDIQVREHMGVEIER